jgi:tetratricopeptide (TPR) repeat protein
MSLNLDEEVIFHLARKLDSPEVRESYLEQVCGDNELLRVRVRALLGVHDQENSFLREPAAAIVATVDEAITEHPGSVIGRYKLLEQIGEGAFGVVYMAEQQAPIRRMTAFKVLKPGMDSGQIIARFEAERQALALMDHPNIAKVLDAGQTSSGRPYFVMDLVRGLPITEFCDQNRLTTDERLELFVSVCQAVQHAHHKAIIHRDIKPSNVLVTLQDGAPLVKVIDFGIAKALGGKLTDKTMYTGFAQLVGTPLYMSPEQAALSNVDVDTRSDIYSLGVLLYELLTGTTPFDKERFKEVGYDELRRIIREEEPPKPSTRLYKDEGGRMKDETKRTKRTRWDWFMPFSSFILHPSSFQELDWIVMKCLEKNRARRYESASSLAREVERYLEDKPVEVVPPSAWYRFRKFARRKKTALAVAGLILFFVALLGGGGGWAIRDRAAREDEIERERRTAESERLGREQALDEAVARALDETGPLMDEGKWLEALAAVERANKLLAAAGRMERPLRLLKLRKELSTAERLEEIYRDPTRNPRPNTILTSGEPTERSCEAQSVSVEYDFFWGRAQDAGFAKEFRDFGIDIEALAPAEAAARIGGTSIRPALIQALDEWAAMRRRAQGGKDAFWKKLLEIAVLADPDEWRNRFRRALLHRNRSAVEKLAEAVPIRDVPPATVFLLGHALKDLGALDKAMAVLREAHRHHPDDFWLNDALGHFSKDFCRPPRYEDALRYYMATLVLRPQNPHTHRAVAEVFMAKGASDEGIAEHSKVIELDPKDANAWSGRGFAHRKLGQWDKALVDFSKVVELAPKRAWPWYNRGLVHCDMRHWDKAIDDYSEAIKLDPKFAPAWINRGFAYARLGQWDKALVDYSMTTELDPKFAGAWNNRGNAHRNLGHWDQALADYSRALELDSKHRNARTNRAHAYGQLGRWEKAAADYAKLLELDPNDHWHWYCSAALRLQIGDVDGYRHACRAMLARFGNTKADLIAHRVALDCVLMPKAVCDPELPLQLAERAVGQVPNHPWHLLILGAAYCRAGRFESAVERLEQSLKASQRDAPPNLPHFLALRWLFLALTYHGMGQTQQAHYCLEQAIQGMDTDLPKPGRGDESWGDWIRCQIVRREAEALLKKNAPDGPTQKEPDARPPGRQP